MVAYLPVCNIRTKEITLAEVKIVHIWDYVNINGFPKFKLCRLEDGRVIQHDFLMKKDDKPNMFHFNRCINFTTNYFRFN